ncbi:uncharacterized protein LOC134063938 [Sardina pilchardus]|uniref:uncharacterized protein LOC134063938 n=1 Tax=Sardina pilchardus TaxID=27697 RepID=UPI002E10E6CB
MEALKRERNHTSSNTSKVLGVFFLAAVLGLPVGFLCGSLAKEEILRRPEEGDTHLRKDWIVHIYSLCWNMSVVICSFSVANAMSVLAYRVIPDDWSQLKKYCLAAPVGLLGLTITGAALGGVEGYIREFSEISYLIWPVVSFLLYMMSRLILHYFVLCHDSILLQVALLALSSASLSPLFLIVLDLTMPAVNPLFIMLPISILFVLPLRAILRTDTSTIHLAPCIILMSPITILCGFPSIQNSVIVLTTHILAVGVGASIHLTLGVTADSSKECAAALVGGSAILGTVQKASDCMGKWGSLGALLGVSGAVGVTLSAAGATAQVYGKWIKENRSTEQGEGMDESRGESDGQGQGRNERTEILREKLLDMLLSDMLITMFVFLLEMVLTMFVLDMNELSEYEIHLYVTPLMVCITTWGFWSFSVFDTLDWRMIGSAGLTKYLRRLSLGMEEFITEWCRAVRVAGTGGISGRISAALGAATGAFLSAGGQDWRFRAIVAFCAAVVPLISYKTAKKPHTNQLLD